MSRPFHAVNSADDHDMTSILLDPLIQPAFLSDIIYIGAALQQPGTSSDTVSLAGSGLIFQNTFLSGVQGHSVLP